MSSNRNSSGQRERGNSNSSSFTSITKLAKQVWKGRDMKRNGIDDDLAYWKTGQQSNLENKNSNEDGKAASRMPPKHTLELVLDALQMRDTPPPQSVRPFVFDLPFVKARLDQMNKQSAPASASSILSEKQPEAGANPSPVFKTFRDFASASGCNNLLIKPRNVIDLEEDHATDRETPTTPTPATKGGKEKSNTFPTPSASCVTSTSKRSNRVAKTDGSAARFRSPDDNVRPVVLGLDVSHPNMNAVFEYRPRNKKSSVMTAHIPPPPQSVRPFVFDLPFVKVRLDQMNKKSAPTSASSTMSEKGVDKGSNRTHPLF